MVSPNQNSRDILSRSEEKPFDRKGALALATGRERGTERELFFERGTGRLVVDDPGQRARTDVVPISRVCQDGFFSDPTTE